MLVKRMCLHTGIDFVLTFSIMYGSMSCLCGAGSLPLDLCRRCKNVTYTRVGYWINVSAEIFMSCLILY